MITWICTAPSAEMAHSVEVEEENVTSEVYVEMKSGLRDGSADSGDSRSGSLQISWLTDGWQLTVFCGLKEGRDGFERALTLVYTRP
jgi:hypothetical protein